MGVWLWTFIGPIALLTLVPAVLTLSGCWEWQVAGPLIGVGTAGAGVAVASAEHAGNKEPVQTPTNEKQEDGSEATEHYPGGSQPSKKDNPIPKAELIEESTLPASTRPVAVAGSDKSVEPSGQPQVGRELVSIGKPRLVARRHRSKIASPPISTPPSILPETVVVH